MTPEERAVLEEEKCDKDPLSCWFVRCQLGRECAGKNRFDKLNKLLEVTGQKQTLMNYDACMKRVAEIERIENAK